MNFGNTNYIEGCKTNQNNDMEILTYNSKEIEGFSDDLYLRRFSEKKEYRDALINTIIGLRNNNIDLN